jgi:hypothetical protein
MTEITYQLREEDIIAFVEHHWANSPTARRSKWISTIRWAYIERLDPTANHLFLYTSAVNGIIVPKVGVTAGDFDSFADAARKYWQDATAAAKANDPQTV